jgi:Fur family ferric uptake transcriptional regulator
MKKHKDLLEILRANKMRITPARRVLLQFILDHKGRQIPLKEFYAFMEKNLPGIDRSSVYRNLEALKMLEIVQELDLKNGKVYQYLLDRKVNHFYICKSCGKSHKGNQDLFEKIEHALKDIHGFSKAKLSVVFYGFCTKCEK